MAKGPIAALFESLYRYRATRQPQPGVQAYGFDFGPGFRLPRQWVSDGYWVPQYFRPLSMENVNRVFLPTTTVVGLGGLVQGQIVGQPLSQPPNG